MLGEKGLPRFVPVSSLDCQGCGKRNKSPIWGNTGNEDNRVCIELCHSLVVRAWNSGLTFLGLVFSNCKRETADEIAIRIRGGHGKDLSMVTESVCEAGGV